MSKRRLPSPEVGKQIALFEVEPAPTPPDCSREGQSIQPLRKPSRQQKEKVAAGQVPASSAVPDASRDSELTSWLAEFMAKSALAEAQREMATNAQVGPPDDDYIPLE